MLLSGGAVFDPVPEAVTMDAAARMLGVSPEDIVLESQSQDTGQQLMFILKKIVTLLLMPMSLCLGVLGVGILLLWVRRRIGAAKIVLTLGFLVLTALSFSAVADPFIKPLELWYPPLLDAGRLKNVNWVVVLGGGHASNPEFPANAQLENPSLARLVEGIRIHP